MLPAVVTGRPSASGAVTVAAEVGPDPGAVPGRSHRVRPWLMAGAAYLALAVFLWWGTWSTDPTSTTSCGSGDASLFTWFLEWPAYAMAHGLDPWYSAAIFHPTGINLLSNTGEELVGVGLAPVTWLFGPVAALNVALTLSPALSALAMFALLRRWVAWAPAAFVGGLLYGFSPLALTALTATWLNMALLVVPPLVVVCLDELLMVQRRRVVPVGVTLGLLCVVQFFISTEVLAIMAIAAVIGIGMVAGWAAVCRRAELRRRCPPACRGLAAAGVVAASLLAFPTWFALDGPAHLSGLVWPSLPPGLDGISLSALVWNPSTAQTAQQGHRFGGYQGPALVPESYLGIGLIAVALIGIVLWRRDRKLWLFGTVGVLCIAMSVSLATNIRPLRLPWLLLGRIPVVENILPFRFMSMTFLCVAVVLGLVVDHAHRSVLAWSEPRAGSNRPPGRGGRPWPRVAAGTAGVAVALVALVPIVDATAGDLPLTVRPVVLPTWFTAVAPHLPAGQVVLAYPSTFGGFQSSLTWQAVDRMSYSTVEGAGPGEVVQRAGNERQAYVALSNASFLLDPSTAYQPSTASAVRDALLAWKVTRVVIPDQKDLPLYERGFNTSYTVGLMTAALGQRPQMQAGAWVWEPARATTQVDIAPAALRACVGSANFHPGPPESVPDCVLAGSG